MKNSARALLFIGVVVFLGSCSVSKNNKKLIIGNWQYEKMSRFNPDKQGHGVRWDTLSDFETLSEFKKMSSGGSREQVIAQTEAMFTAMSVRPDKSIDFKTRRKESHGTWKISLSGKKFTVNDTANAKTYTIKLISIDSSQLTAGFEVKGGKLERIYRRTGQ